MEFRCKLSEVDDLIFALVFDQTCYARKEPIRTYEVHPTEESLGWGRSMVCEFDYTVHIPALKLFLRDAVEYEYDEEEHMRQEREESRKEGFEEGEERINDLYDKLHELNREEDIWKAIKDVEYRKKLLEEFHLD